MSRLLVVGLAPGLNGANRTGRPFTADGAGYLLYPTLIKYGWAKGVYLANANDGLMLQDCTITNVVRCLPPENKPTSSEINNCSVYLQHEISAMPNLRAILALGRIAHYAVIKIMGQRANNFIFKHGAVYDINKHIKLFDSYHCSRYNTSTKRLTTAMFEDVFVQIKANIL